MATLKHTNIVIVRTDLCPSQHAIPNPIAGSTLRRAPVLPDLPDCLAHLIPPIRTDPSPIGSTHLPSHSVKLGLRLLGALRSS